MPALGESVTEGTVTRWLKSEGDDVAVDEPLLEVSTDKVDTEIPSPVAGTLTKILVGEDETVPVGGDLAVIGGSAPTAAAARRAAGTAGGARPAEAPAQPARRHSPRRPHSPGGARPARAPRLPNLRRPLPAPAGSAACRHLRHRARADRGAPTDAAAYVTPPRAQARCPARDRPVHPQGHRRRRPHPQAGRARRCQRRHRPAAPRRPPPAAASAQPRRRPAAAAPAAASVSPKRGTQGEDDAPAQAHRDPDGRVAAGLGTADHRRRGRPDQGGPHPGAVKEGLRGARGRQAQLPALPGARRDRGPQGAPDGQREHRGRRGGPTTAPRTSRSPWTPTRASSSRS